ncbi:MAG: M48 family metalloprotease [Gammaproteobacteria bacterium]|nr:M48 family metalloprotease [Gammaproteobacteria bacterium]
MLAARAALQVVGQCRQLAAKVVARSVRGGLDFMRRQFQGGTEKPDAEPLSDEARLDAKRMNWLPMRTEVLYGERAHAAETNLLERDSKLGGKHYPAADALLAKLLAQVTGQHDYSFQLFILKNASRNAVARPGGFLYLDQGLIDDPIQLPKAHFALAHEIAHVLQRHETRELQGMIVDSFSTRDEMQKAIANVRTDPAAVLANVKVGKDIYARHHADQELQADSCAARLLARVYNEPRELAHALDAFLKDLPAPEAQSAPAAAPNSSAPPMDSKTATQAAELAALTHEIVASPAARHPTTQERTDNLKAIYAEINAGITP